MIKKKTVQLAFAIVALGCNSPKLEGNGTPYDDIDLFRLDGVNKVNELKYPHIVVDSVDKNKRVLTSCYDQNKRDTAIYLFDGFSWNSEYSFWADTGTMTVATRIFPDKIVRLTYVGDSSRKLVSSYSVFDGKHRRSFGLKAPKDLDLAALDSLTTNDSLTFRSEEAFENQNEVLKVSVHTIDYMYDKTRDSTICYHVGKHSVFWWLVFEKYVAGMETSCK
jgi:hypothetical protein